MLFKPEDLNPDYTSQEIEKLFFVRKDLADLTDPQKEALLAKVNSLGLKEIRLDTVHILLCVMHEAREIDQPRFLREVFLPWIELQRKTRPHYERICQELIRIADFEPGSIQEATHSVNVYRNIVSDLFDPYLTLAVASFQFKENTFTSLADADLGQGERNKFEYLTARVKLIFTGKPDFLSGYHPLVRNAISHSGASGVTYRPDCVVFKNIKRGTPAVVDTVIWSFEELQIRVLQLLECITSVEVATEIFGLDCSKAITADLDTYFKFALHALTPKTRKELGERHEQLIQKIRLSDNAPVEKKLEALSQALFYNCGVRTMPCKGVKTSNNESAVMVEVPSKAIDLNDDNQIVSRLAELPRYGILARSVFGDMYETFHVVETDDTGKKIQIAFQISGKELDEYIDERAGLVDLINDGKWTLKGQVLGITVDFGVIEQAENASAQDPFPRKHRP